MALLGQKVTSGSIGILDIYAATGVKMVEERMLAGVLGNGTLMSGLVKTGIGLAAYQFAPSGIAKNALSIGFCMDGAEDVLTGLLGGGLGSAFGGNADADAW